jgi:hypothetical protein
MMIAAEKRLLKIVEDSDSINIEREVPFFPFFFGNKRTRAGYIELDGDATMLPQEMNFIGGIDDDFGSFEILRGLDVIPENSFPLFITRIVISRLSFSETGGSEIVRGLNDSGFGSVGSRRRETVDEALTSAHLSHCGAPKRRSWRNVHRPVEPILLLRSGDMHMEVGHVPAPDKVDLSFTIRRSPFPDRPVVTFDTSLKSVISKGCILERVA